jgi:hypothetical protein
MGFLIVLKKQSLKICKPDICVGVEGCLWNTQAYGLSYYFTNLDFFGFGFSLGEKTSP